MPFLPSIPQATDQLSVSQANLLNNFTILGAIAGNNNAASSSINTSGTNSGFNWLYLPNNGAIPPTGSAFPAGAVSLYGSVNATTNQNELYINKTNQATVTQIAATASTLSVTSAPTSNAGAWTYLPSGLMLVSGHITGILGGVIALTILGTPPINQILSMIVSPYNGTSSGDLNFAVRLINITGTNTFEVYVSSRTTTGLPTGQTGFQWLAVCY